jgi:hypothetical protein
VHKVAARDSELKALNLTKLELDSQLLQMQEDEKRIHAVADWVDNRIIWLDELYDLTERFPDGNSARVIRLEAEPLTRIGKDKHIARMNLEGIKSADSKELESFFAHLNADGRYDVQSKGLNQRNNIMPSERFRGFPQQFSSVIGVEKREPAEYQLKLWKEPPARKRDAQQLNDDPGFGAIGGELP